MNSVPTSSGAAAWKNGAVWSALVMATILLVGAAGYGAGARQVPIIMPVQQRVPLEYFVTEDSFSEIENTRAKLNGLASQFLMEVRLRHHASALGARGVSHGPNPAYVSQRARAINEIERGIEEFRGTEPELSLVQEQLYLLKREQQPDRWLDVYLRVLYEHPTASVVRSNLRCAQEISESIGRERELAAAFHFLTRIPGDLPAKTQIIASGAYSSLAACDLGPGTP
jgi:hypothetical protein